MLCTLYTYINWCRILPIKDTMQGNMKQGNCWLVHACLGCSHALPQMLRCKVAILLNVLAPWLVFCGVFVPCWDIPSNSWDWYQFHTVVEVHIAHQVVFEQWLTPFRLADWKRIVRRVPQVAKHLRNLEVIIYWGTLNSHESRWLAQNVTTSNNNTWK